ncbi:hypothetical protein [Oceanobacillus jeddahense]|uniref:hypothetical protein n=1 Tax=Oceanobacillus jeddahense TaxID=1462527 RepID=UPI000595BF0A|nr:hypothetical protein [Oceanobacillus jeddahense]
MRITITGINFNYDDGFDKDCTSVNVNYITDGINLNDGRPVEISHEQYEETKENKDKMRALVADKIIADATAFIEKVTEYKDSLEQAE